MHISISRRLAGFACQRLVPLLLVCLLGTLGAAAPASAQGPYTLLHSLLDLGTNAQIQAEQGFSVALDGNIAVTGAPYGGVGGNSPGVVGVYNTTTGALLHRLPNPSPAASDNFGASVAVDGTSVVAGAPYVDSATADRDAAYIFGVGPLLRIVPAAPGFATISWTPADSPGFVLQFSEAWRPPTGSTPPAAQPIRSPCRPRMRSGTIGSSIR